MKKMVCSRVIPLYQLDIPCPACIRLTKHFNYVASEIWRNTATWLRSRNGLFSEGKSEKVANSDKVVDRIGDFY